MHHSSILIAGLLATGAVASPWGRPGGWDPASASSGAAPTGPWMPGNTGNGVIVERPPEDESSLGSFPSAFPSDLPSAAPSALFSAFPSAIPSDLPSQVPSAAPSGKGGNGPNPGGPAKSRVPHSSGSLDVPTSIIGLQQPTGLPTGPDNSTEPSTLSRAVRSKTKSADLTASTGSASSSPSSSNPSLAIDAAPAQASTYEQIVVAHHNYHRANHSAPDIAWDAGLASTAAKIAASCNFAHNTGVDGGGYGQNIAAGVKRNNISAIITDLFYNGEVGWFAGNYGQKNPSANFEHWGHFSQVVWKATSHVGCATQDCSSKGLGNAPGAAPYFTVCNYKSPGNYANEYADNVGKPLGKPSIGWSYGLAPCVVKGTCSV